MDTFSPADQALFEIDAGIAKHGFHVTAVFGGDDGPLWAYTVGLLETYGHPELITFGLPPQIAHGVIHAIVEQSREGTQHPLGREHPFDVDGIPVCLLPVLDEYWLYPCDYLLGCSHYYGAKGAKVELRALQLVWSDENGRLPWEPQFQRKFAGDQPLLDESGHYTEPDTMFCCDSDGDYCEWS
jgi:hypothetical protein